MPQQDQSMTDVLPIASEGEPRRFMLPRALQS